MIGWRRGRTRSSATCSGSGTRQRSARFATSIEQLVVGVGAGDGLGPGAARTRRSGRGSCARIGAACSAGWTTCRPRAWSRTSPSATRDGLWWRTQIVLLRAPAPRRGELAVARAARARLARRERARRRARAAGAEPGRDPRAQPAFPARGTRASARAGALRARARRASPARAVEAQIAAAAARAVSRDLTHPFGAPPTSALSLVSPERSRRSETSQSSSDQPARRAAQSGSRSRNGCRRDGRARARGRAGSPRWRRAAANGRHRGDAGAFRPRTSTPWSSARLAARASVRAGASGAARAQVGARVAEVRGVAGGSARVRSGGCVRRGWRTGTGQPWRRSPGPRGRPGRADVARVGGRAIALYEAHAEQRPPGWPASGPGALCALAAPARAPIASPATSRGCSLLAKAMRAAALERDAGAARAAARAPTARQQPAAAARFVFRTRSPRARDRRAAPPARPRRRPARRRQPGGLAERRARPAPTSRAASSPRSRLIEPDRFEELDGIGARATRYRAELARGRWQLPHSSSTHPNPKEAHPMTATQTARPRPTQVADDRSRRQRPARPQRERLRAAPSAPRRRDRACAAAHAGVRRSRARCAAALLRIVREHAAQCAQLRSCASAGRRR